MSLIKLSVCAAVLLCVLGGATTPCAAQPKPTPEATPTPQPTPQPTPASSSTSNRVKEWFCRTFGIDPKVYERLTRVRPGEAETDSGTRLVKLDLRTEQEVELWACAGCWSPTRLNATELVVLKRDGIWLVPPAPATPRLVFPGDQLIAIIGTMPQQPDNLLVIARTNDEQCRYALRVANLASAEPLASRRLQMPPDSPPVCFTGANDLVSMIKASRRRNDVVLSDTRRRGTALGASQLTKLPMLTEDPQPAPLTPLLNSRDDAIGRFSPNWWSDTEIIYVTFP